MSPSAATQSPTVEHMLDGRERLASIQRSRLLAAMVEVAAEHGAANVTVALVTGRSGASRRTFYELFADRETCYLEAFDELVGRMGRAVAAAYESGDSWSEKVRNALTSLLELFETEPEAARLLMVDSLGAGPTVLKRRRKIIELVASTIERDGGAATSGSRPPRVIAEGVAGALASVLHARLLESGERVSGESLLELVKPLTSIVVLPYLGAQVARRELHRAGSEREQLSAGARESEALLEMPARLTYRTVRALLAIAQAPGSSNREIGQAAGVRDQGQISKLLARLKRLDLVINTREADAKGAPNIWTLTPKGQAIQRAMDANLTEGLVK